MTYLDDLEIEDLKGKKILSASIDKHRDFILLKTTEGNFYLTWEGDCCSSCYLYHVSGSEFLMDATIVEIANAEWLSVPTEEESEVIGSMGTKIKTDKGYVDFETRLEHNGYYYGRIMVSKDGPLDQHHQIKDEFWKSYELEPLSDF